MEFYLTEFCNDTRTICHSNSDSYFIVCTSLLHNFESSFNSLRKRYSFSISHMSNYTQRNTIYGISLIWQLLNISNRPGTFAAAIEHEHFYHLNHVLIHLLILESETYNVVHKFKLATEPIG